MQSASAVPRAEERACSALIFGDLPGFSKMPERYLPIFWDQVMGAIGDVLGASKDAVALKNTWGDAIHLRHSRCAPRRGDLPCRPATAAGDRRRMRSGATMRRRCGSARITGRCSKAGIRFSRSGPIYGRALSRAARIEPITPPGTVYVTEAFAAILLLESRGEFSCTYVGQVPLAKGFGTFRMYDLSAG